MTRESKAGKGESIAILGPTGTGKSALALVLARRLPGAAIFSMDAFQVYRGMDIGTGKAAAAERAEVPHELLDLAGPAEAFTVADYLRAAEAALARATGPVIWAGGTGLYYRALRRGLAPAPATDPAVRKELEALPPAELAEELRRADPQWCATGDLRNPRRVVRALAVWRQTGVPLSEWQRRPHRPVAAFDHVFALDGTDDWLRERIGRRVRAMWAAGWPGEARGLLEVAGWEGSPAYRAIGYAEAAAHVRGQLSEEEARERIVRATWSYVKRQRTWLKREGGWTGLGADRLAEKLAQWIAGS